MTRVAPLCSESQARPAKVTRESSTNTRKNQGASESATATTQAAGADRLRRGQLSQCAPRLTSVRRGAVQPLWRPATGRVLRLWRTERYRLKGIFMLYLPHLVSKSNSVHSGRDSHRSMSEAWGPKRIHTYRLINNFGFEYPDRGSRRLPALTRAKTPSLPTYCGRQPPGSVPHLPTYSQAAQRSEKIPFSPL